MTWRRKGPSFTMVLSEFIWGAAIYHDDVIKWKYFHRYRESTGHQWIRFTEDSDAELWCIRWAACERRVEQNCRDPGDLRRHRAHYDTTVMIIFYLINNATKAIINHGNYICNYICNYYRCNFVVSTVTADGLAHSYARPCTCIVLIKFGSRMLVNAALVPGYHTANLLPYFSGRFVSLRQ